MHSRTYPPLLAAASTLALSLAAAPVLALDPSTLDAANDYTDAVLKRVDEAFADSLSQAKSYTDRRYSQGLTGYATTQALNDSFARAISSANSQADQRTWDTLMHSQSYTDAQIDRLDRILSSGIAAVAAQPDLPSLQTGQFGLAVGSGHYNGRNALGARIGFSPIENMLFGVGVSGALNAEESETVVRTSASFVW